MQYDENTPDPVGRSKPRLGLTIGLVSAGIAAGAIGAMAVGAGATTNGTAGSAASGYGFSAPTGTPSGTAAPGTGGHGGPGAPGGVGGAAPVRSDEKALTDSQTATLKAEALKAVPGGTVVRVETDSGDAAYEAHMTKSDGTVVTVKFDSNLKVTGVEDGMGR
ncbi:MAG: hypothetical protein QOE97_3193 [Pseudonocardiales bacterium]|jgi:hypothetical protein|nr:hypothetical protein [Pseudonocardiales bacterium]